MSKSTRSAVVIALFAATLLLSIIIRAPKNNEKVYYSQDASYHVLLTANAYDETPVSVHKFLPIVTLGGSQDKFIPWGDTLCDESGNYYYTSFSAAGFFFPYAFFKLFHLPFTLNSLYIFNSLLYLLCIFLVWYLFKTLFCNSSQSRQLGLFAAAIYAFQTETLHSQGAVYWSQSLFQVFFLLQSICFIKEKKGFFLFFCVLNPYTEWTGYVANAGFALIYLLRKKWLPFFSVCAATVGALALFIFHYALALPLPEILTALFNRFFSRSVASAVGWDAFIKGYIYSYAVLFIILLAMVAFVLAKKSRRQHLFSHIKQNWFYVLMLLFPVLENFLMQQHVVFYTYDRLKVTLPLIYLFLLCVECIDLNAAISHTWLKRFVAVLVTCMACCNMAYYMQDNTFYSQKVDYLNTNTILADYIKEHYPLEECLLAQNNATRGYSNLLFHRGIYEHQGAEEGKVLLTNQRYYIYLESPDLPFNIYQYTSASVYDVASGTMTKLTVQNGSVQTAPQ